MTDYDYEHNQAPHERVGLRSGINQHEQKRRGGFNTVRSIAIA